MDSKTLFNSLDALLDAWCERRALAPLRILLPAYPLTNPLTDGWGELLQALYDLRASCLESLPEDEMAQVEACIVSVEQVLAR
jgi:type VI protein secretion system component VasF